MYAFCVSLCLPSQFFSVVPQLLVFTYDFPQVWESQGDPQHLRLVFLLYLPIPWLALISYHGVCRAITSTWSEATGSPHSRLRTKCDGTRTETRFRLSAKRRVHLKRRGRQFSWLLAAEVCASAVVMLDTPCSEVVWRVLATQSIRQFLLRFASHASSCAITFQLDCTSW
jgi:hypothetical protein